MNKTQLNKKRFVEHELLYMIQRINSNISGLTYKVMDNLSEVVTVNFNDNFKRKIYVSGDSLHALALDVLNRI